MLNCTGESWGLDPSQLPKSPLCKGTNSAAQHLMFWCHLHKPSLGRSVLQYGIVEHLMWFAACCKGTGSIRTLYAVPFTSAGVLQGLCTSVYFLLHPQVEPYVCGKWRWGSDSFQRLSVKAVVKGLAKNWKSQKQEQRPLTACIEPGSCPQIQAGREPIFCQVNKGNPETWVKTQCSCELFFVKALCVKCLF